MNDRQPDVIIWDRESRKKCSIYPLHDRDNLHFIHSIYIVHNQAPQALFGNCIFLHIDGQPLEFSDRQAPLLLLDASWKRAGKLTPRLKHLPKRSLHGFSTSYPRVSKLYPMPGIGLASVEALYIAYLIQGREDPSMLDHYHWKEQFLDTNQEAIQKYRNASNIL